MPISSPEIKPHIIVSCVHCRFFFGQDYTCRFNPPTRLLRNEELIWGWPKVEDSDWCGKWKLSK